MRKIILLSCVSFLISCSDGGDEKTTTDPVAGNKSFTITWQAPSSFEDNSVLNSTDLSEYRIYYGDSLGNVGNNVHNISAQKISFTTAILDKNVIASYSNVYLAMTSVSSDGVESVLSEIISFTP